MGISVQWHVHCDGLTDHREHVRTCQASTLLGTPNVNDGISAGREAMRRGWTVTASGAWHSPECAAYVPGQGTYSVTGASA